MYKLYEIVNEKQNNPMNRKTWKKRNLPIIRQQVHLIALLETGEDISLMFLFVLGKTSMPWNSQQ